MSRMDEQDDLLWTGLKLAFGIMAVAAFLIAAVHAEGSKTLQPRVPFAKSFFAGASEGSASVVVKFREGTDVRLRDGQFVQVDEFTARGAEASERREVRFTSSEMHRLNRDLNRMSRRSQIRRLFVRSEQELALEKQGLEPQAGEELADLNLYYRIDAGDTAEAAQILAQLNASDLVETAYIEPPAEPAVAAEDEAPATSDLTPRQGYLDAAPGGIDARYAWTVSGGRGQNVTIADVEGAWNSTHEDVRDKAYGQLVAGTPYSDSGWNNHGTAVIGEMIGEQNSYGITGIANGASLKMSAVGDIGVAGAIDAAAAVLNPGDVILIEIHRAGPRYNYQARDDQKGYIAVEFWAADYDAIRRATARGIIVVEAAGNGAENLDDAIYNNVFNRNIRDSRAILVGAGAPPSGNYGADRSRLNFSNYGSRVDVQGWGREVFTSGYGDFQGGAQDIWYTRTFSGTSSASPIVTAAVACVQGVLRAAGRSPLAPTDMRALLAQTGTPQQAAPSAPLSQNIGPRPNLRAAIASLNLGGNSGQGQWTVLSATADTPHPYPNNYNAYHYYEHTGSQRVAIHLSRFETEDNYDYLLVYDRSGNLIDAHTGTKAPFWVVVEGDYVKIVLVSDESVTDYGYHIDKVAYFD